MPPLTNVGTFHIQNSCNITGRGLVVLGQLTDGKVKIDDYLTFKYDSKILTTVIIGVEMADNISTGEYWVGLLIGHQNDLLEIAFEKGKIEDQIADISSEK